MRCPCCGQRLEKDVDVCTRCATDITPTSIRRSVLITILYALIVLAIIGLIVYMGLSWHDAQLFDRWNIR